MGTPRFFCPERLPAAGEFRLPEQLSHHATRVLRMGDGDRLVLFDGHGGERPARLVARGKFWHALLGEHLAVERESPLEIVLVQALASGDKMDWVVQKAVELGAVGVIPVESERVLLRLSAERAARRVAHWRQVAVAACEQCGRNRVPEIEAIIGLREYLDAHAAVRDKLVLTPGAQLRLSALVRPAHRVHVLIGPEGGWSGAELTAMRSAGGTPIALGTRVLRTETAGLAAVSALQAVWGDL